MYKEHWMRNEEHIKVFLFTPFHNKFSIRKLTIISFLIVQRFSQFILLESHRISGQSSLSLLNNKAEDKLF
jgi:hypothetical protein